MTVENAKQTSIDFGIDAPGLVRFFFIAGAGAVLVGIASNSTLWGNSTLKFVASCLTVLAAVYLIGMGSLMVYWSRVAKVRGRDRSLDLISWHGGERVLDVGCGRGLMMIGAAQRLTSGRAIGVDIWQQQDQSDNSERAALENARRANVGDRVEVRTADARVLPFEDASFDVVLSHWVVHNLPTDSDRKQAIAEMVRVLRPGGTLLLSDIEHRAAYLQWLTTLGLRAPQAIFDPLADRVLGALSFGSFRPTTIVARAPA